MKSVLLAACALSALAPAAALAAPDDSEGVVSSVIVTARRNAEDPSVVADARKRLSETPGAVSVISQEAYASRQALALDDMLRDAPGVYAQRKWGGDVRISIRGSGIGNASHNRGLLLAQDGVPLNEADGYGDSQIADPLNTRYAEVYRGGNALRFGGALLGGAINMVTPTGKDAGFNARLRVDGGSFGLIREHAAIAGEKGDWDLYAAATNQTSQGWRSQSQQNIQFATLNLGRSFGQDREVRFILNGSNIAQEIPGALTLAQFQANPRQSAAASLANDQARNQRGLRGSLRTTWRLDEHTVFQGAVYAVWKDLDHPIFQVIDQQSRNYGAFGRLDWDGEVGGLKADAYLGAWYRQGDLDSAFYTNVRGGRGALQSLAQQNAKAADVFGEGRLFVTDHVILVGGLTWGRAERDYQSFKVPAVASTFNLTADKDYEWVSPRVGVLWQGDDGSQLFANVTRSVEPPNFSSLSPSNVGFAPIRAQEAWTAEAGARGHRGAFTYDLTAYRAKLKNELLQFAVDSQHPAATFNADDTIHQGIEAALDWAFAPRWRLRQTYTLSDFRFDGDAQYGDNRLPIVPKHFYRAELRYDAAAGWFLAPSVEWSASDQWIDYKNTRTAPSYAILNLNAGWKATDKVSLFLDARNLTDEAYVSNVQAATTWTAVTAAVWPGDGRSVFGGVTVSF
ncbi:TonB-dependent receptor family protein [Caulobacter endophyticus]|uniref:TonB-dependent receptor family protein n=1 Tax=Caulobacter endophyticus TaxID=2172652 RepID=UPI00240F91AF|nr:TonB-dependent receptor [Caulobacter endophyticus]MDG2529432.1 TonB-dependent receptor [Caulobacter endophyticus]